MAQLRIDDYDAFDDSFWKFGDGWAARIRPNYHTIVQ